MAERVQRKERGYSLADLNAGYRPWESAEPVASSEKGTVMSNGQTIPASIQPGVKIGEAAATGGPSAAAITAGALTGQQQLSGVMNAANGKGLTLSQQAALALPTFGASFLYSPVKKLVAPPSTKDIEKGRWNAVGKVDLASTMKGHDYFEGIKGGESRDESLLTPDAIRVNPDNYNNIPEWDTWTKANQDKFLQTMLDRKAVTERKGGIYYDDAIAKQLASEIGPGVATPVATSNPGEEKKARVQAKRRATLAAMYPEMTSIPQYDMSGVKI